MTSNEVHEAVRTIHGALDEGYGEFIASGSLAFRDQEVVVLLDGGMASIERTPCVDRDGWVNLVSKERYGDLVEVANRLEKMARRDGHRDCDGWEIVESIARCIGALDFRTGETWSLEEITKIVEARLVRNAMIERTIWGIFGCHVDEPVELGGQSWLVPASTERRTHFRVKEFSHPFIHVHCYLVCEREVLADDLRKGSRDERPSKVLACMRPVVRADLVAVGAAFETFIVTPSSFAGFTEMLRIPDRPRSYGYPGDDRVVTAIQGAEIGKLVDLIDVPSKNNPARPLQLALQRLNIAATRNTSDDAILDLMIAVESLLSQANEKTEISYRIALRGAQLASTQDARIALRSELKVAYDWRSKIAHGASADFVVPAQVITNLRSFVSLAIRLSGQAIALGRTLPSDIETALMGNRMPLMNLLKAIGLTQASIEERG